MPVETRIYRKPTRRAPRKRDETFNIQFDYNGKNYLLTVKTDYPAGPDCMGWDYDVFEGRKHLYTLNHCKNEDEILCWEIKKKPAAGLDEDLVRQIGRAISAYYGE